MKPVSRNVNIIDYYFSFLAHLTPDSKLDLISRLSQSLKESGPKEEVSLQSLFGAYKSGETADEIIAQLKASRTFNRNTETL